MIYAVTRGGDAAQRLWEMWKRDSRPLARVDLARGEALIEQREG
jgi:hypothetical protein